MKRQGNLIEPIATMDNLFLAYWKAKRGKQHRPEVVLFANNLKENLRLLQKDILEQTIDFGDYHYFKIYDPKERLICATSFRERVLQHALMNVCHVFFERYLIDDSYACRIGKGTYAALDRAKVYSKKYRFFAKLDVRKFFETMNHGIIKRQLTRLFKDEHLLQIFFGIIDSYENLPHQGVPIGNLTSQYFANHYLGEADHFVKNEIRVKGYVRYMDDMVLWDNDWKRLKKNVRRFRAFLEKQLQCEMKPNVMNDLEKGLPFLGYVLFPRWVHLAKRSRSRFRRKYKLLNRLLAKQVIDQEQYHARMLPTIAFTQKADALWFRKKILFNAV